MKRQAPCRSLLAFFSFRIDLVLDGEDRSLLKNSRSKFVIDDPTMSLAPTTSRSDWEFHEKICLPKIRSPLVAIKAQQC